MYFIPAAILVDAVSLQFINKSAESHAGTYNCM